MKRKLLTAILALIISAGSLAAENLDGVFDRFRDSHNAEYIKVPSLLMKCASVMGEKVDFDELGLKGSMSGCRVLDMSNCSRKVREAFRDAVLGCDSSDMEELLRVSGEGKTRIWVKHNGDKIKKLYIFTCDSAGESVLVEISGKFKMSDAALSD